METNTLGTTLKYHKMPIAQKYSRTTENQENNEKLAPAACAR